MDFLQIIDEQQMFKIPDVQLESRISRPSEPLTRLHTGGVPSDRVSRVFAP